MTIAKKMWQKPEMIVLVRSNPEEYVLAGCKQTTSIGPGNNTCDLKADGSGGSCSGIGQS